MGNDKWHVSPLSSTVIAAVSTYAYTHRQINVSPNLNFFKYELLIPSLSYRHTIYMQFIDYLSHY